MITAVRSVLFDICFYVWGTVCVVTALPLVLLPRPVLIAAKQIWAVGIYDVLLKIAGLHYQVRGDLPTQPCIIAAKHQSAWDTIFFHRLFPTIATVLKKELMQIPLFGAEMRKAGMIPVDRKGGAKAVKAMIKAAREAIDRDQMIMIFPEGTRSPVDQRIAYQPGIAAIYGQLDLPVVPVALNSGLYWPRRSFLRHPGTVIVEFLEPIPPGLKRKEFMAVLEGRIEAATARLVAEGRGETGTAVQ